MIAVEKFLETATPQQLSILKYRLQTDYFSHASFFLSYRESQPFILGRHHPVMMSVMKRVFDGEITRLIINMPPSYTKTELTVIQFASFGFANNPGARFLHISGDKDLVLDNSSKIKDQVLSDLAGKLWGVNAKEDTKAKGLWKTNHKGAFYARTSHSKLVGFRAGRSRPGFQGALLIDDPQDEDEVRSPVRVDRFPKRYMGVIRHRVDNRRTPVVIVMQRLGDDDFTNFLLEGGSGEKWYWLCLPSPIPDEFRKNNYSHAIPIKHNLIPGALWKYKHTDQELETLEKADDYIFAAQYLQHPQKKDGNIFKSLWWEYYKVLPDYEYKAIFCDTALKAEEYNDYTVFQCWAKWRGRIYLIDQFRERIEASDLKQALIEFWNKHKGNPAQPNRGVYIEDKASGIQLIQDIRRKGSIPVIPIPREKSKVFRANNLVNWIKAHLLYLSENAEWLYDYKKEFKQFNHLMTHAHDDQIDPTLDAIENMLIIGDEMKEDEKENYGRSKPLAPQRTERVW